MRVMQTLGRQGKQEGVFQYRRTPAGVVIDTSIGTANLNPVEVTLTNSEWTDILTEIAKQTNKSLRLTKSGTGDPPTSVLYEIIEKAVPKPTNGWSWHTSWKSYVCAILEHEGSVDLYAGSLGPKHQAHITLARDF